MVQSQRLRVQEGDDQRLDQELRYLLCEERPDPADAAEGKSAVMLRGQSGDRRTRTDEWDEVLEVPSDSITVRRPVSVE